MKKPDRISPKFEQIINSVWDRPRIAMILLCIDYVAVIFAMIALTVRVAFLITERGYIRLISELAILGSAFAAVSVFRRIVNMPRPYEIGNITRLDSSKKRGQSFPSRHVFSAFVIATVITPWSVWLAIALFVMGAAMAAVRVLIGRHFIRDVIAGAIIGIASGVIGLLILHFAGI